MDRRDCFHESQGPGRGCRSVLGAIPQIYRWRIIRPDTKNQRILFRVECGAGDSESWQLRLHDLTAMGSRTRHVTLPLVTRITPEADAGRPHPFWDRTAALYRPLRAWRDAERYDMPVAARRVGCCAGDPVLTIVPDGYLAQPTCSTAVLAAEAP